MAKRAAVGSASSQPPSTLSPSHPGICWSLARCASLPTLSTSSFSLLAPLHVTSIVAKLGGVADRHRHRRRRGQRYHRRKGRRQSPSVSMRRRGGRPAVVLATVLVVVFVQVIRVGGGLRRHTRRKPFVDIVVVMAPSVSLSSSMPNFDRPSRRHDRFHRKHVIVPNCISATCGGHGFKIEVVAIAICFL